MTQAKSGTINHAALWALLDTNEQRDLLNGLGGSATALEEGIAYLAGWALSEILAKVIALRSPFIRMMGQFCELLGALEASAQGNIRFVILPDWAQALALDVGPQMQAAVATALNPKWLTASHAELQARIQHFDQQAARLCNKLRPRAVDRLSSQGRLYQELGDRMSGGEGFKYRWAAENILTHSSYAYNPADTRSLENLCRSIAQLAALQKRLSVDETIQIPDALTKLLRFATAKIEAKFSEVRAKTSSEFPHPPRSAQDGDFVPVAKAIEAVREALLALSDFNNATGSLFDFMGL